MNIEALARPEILAMKPYASARGTAGADGVLLNANEAPVSLLPPGPNAYLPLNRYPPPQPAELGTRLSELYGVPETQLLVTRGSDEGIDLLTRVFCRPGLDAIVECPPGFGMYRVAASIQGAKVIAVPRMPESLVMDFDALLEVIESGSTLRLVFLTSPNNPTGDVIRRSDLERVLGSCGEHALVVLDEAYIEFCDTPSAVALLSDWPNLVVLRTLSKAWAAAGLRCGAVLAREPVIALLKRVMAPYPLSTPAIGAALEATSPGTRRQQAAMLQEIRRCKSRLLDALEQFDWIETSWPGEANFVLLRVDDGPGLTAHCAAQGIRIRDFSAQELLDNCVRVSVGTEREIDALIESFETWRPDP